MTTTAFLLMILLSWGCVGVGPAGGPAPGITPGVAGMLLGSLAARQAVGEVTRSMGASSVSGSASSDAHESTGVLAEASHAGVHTEIHSIGPSHWAKKATWHEVRFTLRNLTSSDVSVLDVRANSGGVLIGQTGLEQYAQQHAPNQNPYGGMNNLGVAADMMIGLPVFSGYTYGQYQDRVQHYQSVQDELQRRQIHQVTLAPGGSITGSAFFPADKSLSEIVFTLANRSTLRVALHGTRAAPASKASSTETTYRRTPRGYEPINPP